MRLPSKTIRRIAVASAIVLALALALGIVWRGREGGEVVGGVEGGGEAEVAVSGFRHPLDGAAVGEETEDLPGVYAVMIDNAVDAWPPSGIERAFLVIEAPVEAGIPRYEAFFAADAAEAVDKIGPVRSARPYFVDWANEFDALYAHVGGSNAALEVISSTGTFDLNEFYNASSFWRASDRYAPHNAYTSTELLAAAVGRAEERGRAPDVLYGVWEWKGGEGVEGVGGVGGGEEVEGGGIGVAFHSDLYAVEWGFDREAGRYVRWQGGREAFAAGGTRLMADNVGVVVTDIDVIDSVGRRDIRTTGEGRAWLLRDGETVEAIWKKPSATERLAFYAADGTELPMVPGTTWIEIVDGENDVTVRSD